MNRRLLQQLNGLLKRLNSLSVTCKLTFFPCLSFTAVVIDLDQSPNDRSAHLTRHQIEQWESRHGQIPKGAFVLLRTGWSQLWKQPDKVLGNFAGIKEQVYPGEVYTLK